jgi:hypothetical protein
MFLTNNSGPWYLTPYQQAQQQHDRSTGKTKLVKRSKKQLLEALKDRGAMVQQQRGCTIKELQDFARNNQIDLYDCKEVIAPGWDGKPKGLLPVLGERGLIERALFERYTLYGRKDTIAYWQD